MNKINSLILAINCKYPNVQQVTVVDIENSPAIFCGVYYKDKPSDDLLNFDMFSKLK